MELNREEAIRARRIAVKKLEKRDFFGAQRVALQAQRLYPELENLSQLLTVCKVYCAAEERMNRQLDWYSILQVEVTADDTVIRKQYDEIVCWLHPNKNTLPGAEAAFKLVSEAHTVLCDHVKRSRYDIKRQATHLSDRTVANRSGVAKHGKPYDLTVVFWTICPHCRKRFVYYQRNFLVTCDDCGKNFFAFKLNEQAVPSTILSAAPKNSQVSQETVSCQQHAVPDQLVQFSKIHATGGSMNPSHTDEPMNSDERTDGYGEISSEARSNAVQCSAVNETHSLSASADKGTTGSVILESLDHDIVANQNLSREGPSTVLNAAGSCNLQRLGKRKQDDCADSSPSRNSCNCKRQSKDCSLADVNSVEDKMYIDVPGADNQAAKDLPGTVDFQDEGNATHGGSQQQYKKEVADINNTNHMHDNPVITYEFTESSRDSCNDERQKDQKDNSLTDAILSGDKICSDNVAGTDNEAAEHVLRTADRPDKGNAIQEERQRNYKEGTDFGNQMHGNPVITYECTDSSHNRDSCNNRRQRKEDNSLTDDPSDDKVYSDNFAGAGIQAAERAPSAVNGQGEGTATQEGSPQKYKEGTDIADQMHVSPAITYDCADSSCSRDSCNNNKQRKDNSVADANSSYDKICNDDVADTENQVAEQAPSTVDSQDEGNATHKGSEHKYKKEGTDIAKQKHDNSVISYECPDFFDFVKLRDVNMVAVNQIWAIYDDLDFMPRVYAQINHVDASSDKVQLTWLEHNPMSEQKIRWTREELPSACGSFCLGETYVLQDPSMYLSHRVSWAKGKNGNSFEIRPDQGEIWALYKESSLQQSSDTNHQPFSYDVVEVSNVSMNVGIVISPLVRIEGFVSLFAEVKDKPRILIPSSELFRFSHSIPCYRTNGKEKVGVGGLLELDPAALPCDLGSAFPSITLDSYMNVNKKRVTESFGVTLTYPDSEFHNFDEDRSREKFEHGQVWALYSNTDTFPNLYGWINKVEKEPFKVHLTWLKVCPRGIDKHWLEQDIPVSCGKFGLQNLTSEHHETCAFSHLVVTRCQIGPGRQVKIAPKAGEVWAIYKNWAPGWVPSSKGRPAEYAIGMIMMCTETSTLFAFLTKVDGYISVFKPDMQKGALEIPRKENLRFSHQIPSFRLTKENSGTLHGFYELDPAAVPEVLL